MTERAKVVVVGGHGKVALLAAPLLAAEGLAVDSLIRDPAQVADVEAAGAHPVLLDIERAGTDELASAFTGAAAVVFSAGAGGGNPERTRAVDFEAAVRTMEAARQAGVERYVMVSYVRAATDVDRLERSNPFYPYARAKHDADEHLRGAGLDHTILGPGSLTLEEGSGRIRLVDGDGRADGRELAADECTVSRANVAAVIAHVVTTGAASRRTVDFYDGDTPIAEALA